MNSCEQMVKGYAMLSHVHDVPLMFQMLSEHGKVYKGKVNAAYTGRGIKQQCYRNAENMVTHSADHEQFVYVEGYACKPGLIPLQHAFVLDLQDGMVIDPTWEGEGIEYFGCAFRTEFVNKVTLKAGTYSIFENLYKVARDFKRPEDVKAYLVKGLLKR